jgi:hypothetical protein
MHLALTKCRVRPQVRSTYRPRLEVLEDRRLPSVSATLAGGSVSLFIRYNNGELFLHNSAGFHRIDINVASVSAGVTAVGATNVPAAFIVYNNGQLFEWAQATGFSRIDSNVVAVEGQQSSLDSVFILYNNGEVFRHQGRSPVSGFSFIASAVTSMSITFGGSGDLFYVQTNHMLLEHLTGGGSAVIDGNVQSVSASIDDRAFIVYTNSALFEFNGMTHTFTSIDMNVASVSAGSSNASPAAFYVTRDGVLVEWQPPTVSNPDGTYNFVDANVASVVAFDANSDDVFIIYNNDMLFEHTGLSRKSGFSFIDSNVSP